MAFKEKWLEAVKRKNSVLCAGLDPAEFELGRGTNGLPERASKFGWSAAYVNAIAPFCAAIKPNLQYWRGIGDEGALRTLASFAHEAGLVVILDAKLADISDTNDAGMFSAKQSGADAVTIAPFAGNMEEAAKQGKKYDIGVISMCLMSNPEYEAEKNKLVPLANNWQSYQGTSPYLTEDLILVGKDAFPHVKQYLKLASDAWKFGIDGIVIGAPSKKNHIKDEEIKSARGYAGEDRLVLLPGVGAQGGEAGAIWEQFNPENVIVNVGRSLMLPNGSNSTPEQQAAAAKQYMEMLNSLRGTA